MEFTFAFQALNCGLIDLFEVNADAVRLVFVEMMCVNVVLPEWGDSAQANIHSKEKTHGEDHARIAGPV